VVWWVGSYPLLSQAPTQVEVELGCDNSSSRQPRWLKFDMQAHFNPTKKYEEKN
jgi:hypothetical protein